MGKRVRRMLDAVADDEHDGLLVARDGGGGGGEGDGGWKDLQEKEYH